MNLENYDCTSAGRTIMIFRHIAVSLLGLFIFIQVQAQSPGGVSTNLKLWLKADAGVSTSTNNTGVSQWNDQAGTLNASQGTAGSQPLYKDGTAGINFNPAIAFDGTNDYLANAGGGFYSQQYYLVLVNGTSFTSATAGQTPLSGYVDGSSDVTGFHFGSVTARFANEVISHNVSSSTKWGSAFNSTTASIPANTIHLFSVRNNAATGANGTDIYQNSVQINNLSANAFQEVTNSRYKIGSFEDISHFFNGKIAEVITYSARNNDTEKSKIESYLALKYGVHLETDYVSSAGSIIWNKGDNAGYHHDVTGIGRDDNSSLSQKQSHSAKDETLSIGLAGVESTNIANTNTFSANNSFLIWGHNNGSTSIATTINSQLKRMDRIWKVANVGTVGNVMVRLSNSYFTGPVTESPVLIISTDDTIDANDQIIELQKSGSYQRHLTTLPDGAYFTFGIQTVPPLMIPISYTKN